MTYVDVMPSTGHISDTISRRDSRITTPVPEHAVLQNGTQPGFMQQGMSPFEQAAQHMPPNGWPSGADWGSEKPKKKSGLLSCFKCFGGGQQVEEADFRDRTGSDGSAMEAPALAGPIVSTVGPLPSKAVSRRLSGHKTWDYVHQHQTRCSYSRQSSQFSDADWFDAVSHVSGSHSADQDELDNLEAALQAQVPGGGTPFMDPSRGLSMQRPLWVPEEPLIFAPPDLQFVPVPKVTGFAAYWDNDMTRTTPHPQPIDIMIKANFLVKQVHKSIPGLWVQENDSVVTVVAKPKLVPPGYTAYMEVYDKTNQTEPMWSPRRDMNWGSCSGRVYMTTDGVMILVGHARPIFSNEIEFVTEDYLVLEQDGNAVVDRMCCLEVATGRKAVQYQVGVRRERPPFGWGTPIGPDFRPGRILQRTESGQVNPRS